MISTRFNAPMAKLWALSEIGTPRPRKRVCAEGKKCRWRSRGKLKNRGREGGGGQNVDRGIDLGEDGQ